MVNVTEEHNFNCKYLNVNYFIGLVATTLDSTDLEFLLLGKFNLYLLVFLAFYSVILIETSIQFFFLTPVLFKSSSLKTFLSSPDLLSLLILNPMVDALKLPLTVLPPPSHSYVSLHLIFKLAALDQYNVPCLYRYTNG